MVPVKTRSQDGVALIVALLVVVIVIAVTLQFSYTTTIDLKLARNQSRELQAYYAARGVVALAKAHLRADLVSHQGDYGADTLQDVWAQGARGDSKRDGPFQRSIGEVAVEYSIVDEERKVCINNLVLEEVPVPPPEEENGEASEPVQPTLQGHPEADPRARAKERREKTRNYIREILRLLDVGGADVEGLLAAMEAEAPFAALTDLHRIKGMTPELLLGSEDESGSRRGLVDFLTVRSAGRININTASREVLMAVLTDRYGGDAGGLADEIIRFRSPPEKGKAEEPPPGKGPPSEEGAGGVFHSVEELAEKIPGLGDIFGLPEEETEEDEAKEARRAAEAVKRQLTVRSEYFSVRVTTEELRPRKEYTFLLRRGFRPEEFIPVLIWEEREIPSDPEEDDPMVP